MTKLRITRQEVAKRLAEAGQEVTLSYIHDCLDGTHLHPVKDGWRVTYDLEEVEAFIPTFERRRAPPARRSQRLQTSRHVGDIAAKVFMMVQDHKTYHEIVATLRHDPELIARYFDYATRDPFDIARELKEKEEEHEHRRFLAGLDNKHRIIMARIFNGKKKLKKKQSESEDAK